MRGQYFDYLDKELLVDTLATSLNSIKLDKSFDGLDHKHSAAIDDDLILEKLKRLNLQKVFTDADPLLADYAPTTNPFKTAVIKTKENPPRYVLKQTIKNTKTHAEAILTLAFTLDEFGQVNDVSAANVLSLKTQNDDKATLGDLPQSKLYPWKKTDISTEQLKDWAAAEYFIHHIYTEKPLDPKNYGRVLNEYGSEGADRQSLHEKNPLFFPINILLHNKSPRFALDGVMTVEESEQLILSTPRFESLPDLIEYQLKKTKNQHARVHERVTHTRLLHDEYARRLQYLQDNQGQKAKYIYDSIFSYGYELAQVAGNNHLALSAQATGIYLQRVLKEGATKAFDEDHLDNIETLYVGAFGSHFKLISSQGHTFSDRDMTNAYQLYKEIINAHFDQYLNLLTDQSVFDLERDIDSHSALQIARFLLLNPELNNKVRTARPTWYYQLMMSFSPNKLDGVLPRGYRNDEIHHVVDLLSGNATKQFEDDCHAALALVKIDKNTELLDSEAVALTKKILAAYQYTELNFENPLFYQLILTHDANTITSIFNAAKDDLVRSEVFEEFSASALGRVSYSFEHDLKAVETFINLSNKSNAQSILNAMYAKAYYSALPKEQQQRLNQFCSDQSETLGAPYLETLKQLAAKTKLDRMGYFDRFNLLRAQNNSFFSAFVNAFSRKNLVLDNWNELTFERSANSQSLRQLKLQSPPITPKKLMSKSSVASMFSQLQAKRSPADSKSVSPTQSQSASPASIVHTSTSLAYSDQDELPLRTSPRPVHSPNATLSGLVDDAVVDQRDMTDKIILGLTSI